MGFDLTKALDPAEADEVLGWLNVLDQPYERPALVKEITRCLLLTKARAQDQTDQTLMLSVLTSELSEFPADVVASELRSWSRREKWWPTLSELRDRCQQAMRVRKSLRRCCDRAAFGLVKVPA